jgi:DNA-binding response OmpR family regulator
MDLKALLLCSDAGSAQLLSSIMAEQEISVSHASNAEAALALVAEQRLDALVLDAEDEERAREILSKARLSKLNSGALVIALVGNTSNVRQFFSMGANFVLYKPISPERARVSLRAARALMRRERRRVPRIPVCAPAGIAYANVEDARSTMLDVSEEGAAIQSERKLPPSCKVYFQFTLPGQTKMVRLSGEIAWQDSVGIRFVDVPQASRRVLKEWLLHNDFRKESKAPQRPAAPPAPPVGKASDPEDGLQRFRALPGNRRGESRHACTLGAEVYRLGNAVPNRCNLSDISAGGCYVEMPSPFESQTGVEIIVRTKSMKIRVRGVVQSVHPGFGMGVRFTLKDASEADHVQQLVSLISAGPFLEPKVF